MAQVLTHYWAKEHLPAACTIWCAIGSYQKQLATPLPCPSSHCCATCLMIYLCGWVRSVELVMIIIKQATHLLMQCTDHRRSQAWAAARVSPIIAPVLSTSYL